MQFLLGGALYCNNVPKSETCVAFVKKYARQAISLVGTEILAPGSQIPTSIFEGYIGKDCKPELRLKFFWPPRELD